MSKLPPVSEVGGATLDVGRGVIKLPPVSEVGGATPDVGGGVK